SGSIMVAAMTAALSLSDANLEILRARRAAKTYAAVFCTRQLLISVFSLALAARGHGHLGLVAGMCAGNFAVAVLSLIKQASAFRHLTLQNLTSHAAVVAAYGWPL